MEIELAGDFPSLRVFLLLTSKARSIVDTSIIVDRLGLAIAAPVLLRLAVSLGLANDG